MNGRCTSISRGKTRKRIQDFGKQVVLWVSVGVPSLARLRASQKASQLIRLRVSHLFFSWGAVESDEFGGFDFCLALVACCGVSLFGQEWGVIGSRSEPWRPKRESEKTVGMRWAAARSTGGVSKTNAATQVSGGNYCCLLSLVLRTLAHTSRSRTRS